MAEQNLDREYANIKAGVEGVLDDVPSPSEAPEAVTTEIAATETANEGTTEIPQTDYGGSAGSYENATDYGASAEQPGIDASRMHEIVEAIVSEKFDDLVGNLGDLGAWKEKVNHDVVSIKQELLRVQERFENLQNAILGRIKEYDSGITNVHTELKALEKVLERILEPLVTNVKELGKITEELKKKK